VPDRAGPELEAVFREHHARIVGMLARLVGDRGRAEDIAGDVFCKLARSRAIPADQDGVASWIYRVASNAGFDALRSGARRRRREEAAGVESLRAAEPAGALEDLLRAERRARVRQTLQAMKPRDARLLLLRSEGVAYREIAQAMGVAPASVGTLLVRAEAAFERKFRARYGGWR
jgi:RNA polymerase sigma-70 factor (ECF subfamily)